MANSFTDPIYGAGEVPSPDAVVSGQEITAETVGKLTSLINFTHAHLGCSPMVSQGWPDSTFQVTSTPGSYNAIYRIPIPSKAHQTLVILVKASNGTSNGNITIEEQTNLNSTTIPINSASSIWFRSTLSVGTQPDPSLVVHVTASQGSGSATTTIDFLSLHWLPLTSPLAAGEVEGLHTSLPVTPLGATRSTADHPISSARGKSIIHTLTELSERPRSLMNWSGLQLVDDPRVAKTMLPDTFRDTRHIIRSWGGSRERDHVYSCAVFAATHGVSDRVIRWRRRRETIPQAVVAPTWVTLTSEELEEKIPASSENDTDIIEEGLDQETGNNLPPASAVWSVSIWGP